MIENREAVPKRRVVAASEATSALFPDYLLLSPTRRLRTEQSPANGVPIGQCRGDLKPVQVLGQPSIPNLMEAKDPLDHPDRVFDFGADPRLVAVRGFDLLIDLSLDRNNVHMT